MPINNQEPDGGFLNAVARGVDQTQATLYGFADMMGELTGINWLEEFGEEGVKAQIDEITKNPAEVQRWDDVDSLSGFGTWAMERLGEQVPNIALDLGLYAAASVLAAPTGGSSVAAVTGAKVAQKTALATLGKKIKRVAVQAGQRKTGLSAVGVSAAVQGMGETQLELAGEGVEAPVTAIFTGLAKGGLDVVGLDRIFKSAKAIGMSPGGLVDVASKAVKEAGQAAGFEGVTEGIQTVLDKVAVNAHVEDYDIFSRDNWAEIVESAAAGALVGGVVSGGLGGAQGLSQAYDNGDLDSVIEQGSQAAQSAGQKARDLFDQYGPAFQTDQEGNTNERVIPDTRKLKIVPDASPPPSQAAQDTGQPDGVRVEGGTPEHINSVRNASAAEYDRRAEEGRLPPSFDGIERDQAIEYITAKTLESQGVGGQQPAPIVGLGEDDYVSQSMDKFRAEGLLDDIPDGGTEEVAAGVRAEYRKRNSSGPTAQPEGTQGGATLEALPTDSGLTALPSSNDQDGAQGARLSIVDSVEENPNTIAPEPEGDTNAQLDLVRNPESTKRAAVITPDTDLTNINTEGLEQTTVLTEESDQPYQIFTRQGDGLAQQLAARGDKPLSTVELGSLLTTPELAAAGKGDGTVVQARTPDGFVGAEVAVDAANVPAAIADLEQQAPGQEIVVTDVIDGLQRRFQQLEEDTRNRTPVGRALNQIRNLSIDNQQSLLGDIQTKEQMEAFIDALAGGPVTETQDTTDTEVGTLGQQFIDAGVTTQTVNDPQDIQTNDYTQLETPQAGEVDAVTRTAFQPELNPVERGFESQAHAEQVLATAQDNPNTTHEIVELPPSNNEDFSRLAIQTTYAPDNISGEQTVPRAEGPPVIESERFDTGINKGLENGSKGRRALEPKATIMVGEPGKRVKRPIALMDLTMAGADVRSATGIAQHEPTAESLLSGLTTTLVEMAGRGYDVSDAFTPDGKIKPSLIFYHGNLKDKNVPKLSVSRVLGKGSERGKRQAAFAELHDSERALAETNARTFEENPESNEDRNAQFERFRAEQEQAYRRVVQARENVESRFSYDTSNKAVNTLNETETLQGDDEVDHGLTDHNNPRKTKTKDTFAQNVKDDVRDDKWANTLKKTPERRTPFESVRSYGLDDPKLTAFARGIMDEIGLSYPIVLIDGTAKNIRAWHKDQKNKHKNDSRHHVLTDEEISDVIDAITTGKTRGRVYQRGNEAFIFLQPVKGDDTPGGRLWVLGHEIGHIVLDTARKNATPEQMRRLKKAWKKDMAEAKAAVGPKEKVRNNWSGKEGFDEWFADKVSARAANINKKQVNAGLADRFIQQAAKLMAKTWNAVKSRMPKRFHVNRTVDSVIEEWKTADAFDNTVFAKAGKTPAKDDLIEYDGTPVREFINNLELGKHTRSFREAFAKMPENAAVRWLFTVDGQLRAEAPALAKMLYQRTNEVVDKRSFQGGVRAVRDKWIGEVQQTMRKYTPEQREEIFYILSTEQDSDNPGVVELRKTIDNYYNNYLDAHVRELPPAINNYFPRDYNTKAIEARQVEFMRIIEKDANVSNSLGVAQTLTAIDAEYTQRTRESMTAGWEMERTITDPKVVKELVDQGFLNADPEMGLARYIEKTSRRAEFERLFGDMEVTKGGETRWNPNAKLDQMVADATTTVGVKDDEKAARIRNLVSHTVFHQPVNTDSLVYNVVGEIRAFESLRVLAGSGIASIPEVAAIFARAKGSLSMGDFMKQFGGTIKNYDDAKEVALALGIVRNQMSSAMMTEMLMHEGDVKRGFFRKALPALFKYNGNDAIVNYSRTLAVGVGVEFIQNEAVKAKAGDTRAKRYLAELGLSDPDTVIRWQKDGGINNLWNSSMKGQQAQDTQAVQDAINRFVTESVLHPNSSERPTWVNSPLGSLVFHLKTFAYTYSKNILGGMYRELDARAKEGDTPSQSAMSMVQFAAPSMFVFMLFGALSEEIRQRLFTLGERGGAKRANGDPVQYLENITSRSGLFTVPFAEIVTGRGDTIDRAAYVAGPSIHHLYGTLFDDKSATSKLVNSVPILSQFPTVRREIYNSLE
jgi:hypothetical protein